MELGKITKLQPSKIVTAKTIISSFVVIILALIIIVWHEQKQASELSLQIQDLSGQISSLKTDFGSTTKALQEKVAETHTAFTNQLSAESQNVNYLQQKVGTYAQQVGSYTSTVSNLQKLSQIDPQLLKKYSKVYFLNENYIPAHLSEIPNAYRYSDAKTLTFLTEALPHLQTMIDDANKAGVTMYAFSAYRSFDEQKALKSDYSVTYGAGTANSFSADQGYSEHQLGTALDFIAPGQGGVLDGFDTTKAYQWLLQNAHKYGFILSYPKDNKYYVFEPWHWRFVGVKLAADLFNKGQHFYDLDQRNLDTYLVSIFD
jgi:LAS superfamily LD-carboxypeptidase LdcB